MKLSLPGSENRRCLRFIVTASLMRCIAVILLLALFTPSYAQTLFTYGKHAVSRDEFMRAYSKNNADTSSSRLSFNDYLNLYINFKLKVQAALDAKLDTTAEQISELRSFRNQIAENYIREDASINILVNEAFERSLKDIHLSHIYVAVGQPSNVDSVNKARAEIDAAYKRLQKGEAFDKVAKSYQHGVPGYITAFVLPYQSESIAYATPAGKFSAPFQNQSGFHILRNNYERAAVGKIRAAQILLAFEPGMDENSKQLAMRADSVYKALRNGADFAELARTLSDDHLTYHTGGEMPAFGVGQYDTAFEAAAFSLEKDGEISTPVKTRFGYHIIKRLQRVPVIDDPADQGWREVLRERVLQSDRMQVAQAKLVENIKGIIRKDATTGDLSSDSAALDFYRNNLENYNADFASQLHEFREGNLLFAIMQKRVWDAATSDTAGLQEFYEKNKSKYNWENSADALIVTCLVADSVETVQASLAGNHRSWRRIVEETNGLVQVDSGRFELNQIPVVERTNFQPGLITAAVVNEPDSSRTFAYIVRLYNGPSQKSFADAKGMVINDYQAYLEEQWVAELRRKYPVKVNQKVLAKLRN